MVTTNDVNAAGRILKVKLGMVIADSPARLKVGGIKASKTSGRSCPYCSFDIDDLGNTNAVTPSQRGADHRVQSLACLTSSGRAQHDHLGVRYSILNELSYYSTPLMCPPDYMHAIHLGLCKRFFHLLLVNACGSIGSRLEAVQRVIARTMLPSTAPRPDSRIGEPSGGNPSAQQWLTLFRNQLVFALIEIWAQPLSGAKSLSLEFKPQQKSNRRMVLMGYKPVDDVFEAAVLLSLIVDMMERGSFTEREVRRLEEVILRFNRQQANLLGPGWLTYNSHIAEHIPGFIRRYGTRKYQFRGRRGTQTTRSDADMNSNW